MAKSVHNDVLDAAFNVIKNNCNSMSLCSQQPTTYTEAVVTYKLADVAMASGDFTIGDGDVNGRKMAVAAKTAVPVDANGTGTHIALCDGVRLLLVTQCTSLVVNTSTPMDFPTWDEEIADPV